MSIGQWWTRRRSRRATVTINSGSTPIDGRAAANYIINGKRQSIDWEAARNLAAEHQS